MYLLILLVCLWAKLSLDTLYKYVDFINCLKLWQFVFRNVCILLGFSLLVYCQKGCNYHETFLESQTFKWSSHNYYGKTPNLLWGKTFSFILKQKVFKPNYSVGKTFSFSSKQKEIQIVQLY